MRTKQIALTVAALFLGCLLFIAPAAAATPNILHSFVGGSADASNPQEGGLVPSLDGSVFYGMTVYGGAGSSAGGVIFSFDPAAKTVTVLYTFTGVSGDGYEPQAGPILSGDGKTLYGMTQSGGSAGRGILFAFNIALQQLTILHNFNSTALPNDGLQPLGGLTFGGDGTTLYGTTNLGGAHSQGVLFSYDTAHGIYTVLRSFGNVAGDGADPWGEPTLGWDGHTLYGMAEMGGGACGGSGCGLIYSYDISTAAYTILHLFMGGTSDGRNPYGDLTLGSDGHTLYGMTEQGGGSGCGGYGCGTIFSYDTAASAFTLLHAFTNGTSDGAYPMGNLTLVNSTLYGMTNAGGTNYKGTIFSYNTATSAYSVLYSFLGKSQTYGTNDGSSPNGNLTFLNSVLYGMTGNGGTSDRGAIFSFSPFTTLKAVKSGTGSGAVTSNVTGINCGSTCSASFDQGTVITLTAAADTGSTFGGWSGGGCSGTGACKVTLSSDVTVTASFALNAYQLTANITGTGTGTLAGTGLGCTGLTCTGTYNYNTTVNITATANTGSSFGGWLGCNATNGNVCTVLMASVKYVTATFTLNTENLTVTETGNGTGTLQAAGLNCTGTTCTGTYNYNTTVNITATANTGSSFSYWNGCDTGSKPGPAVKGKAAPRSRSAKTSGNVCAVTMTSDKSASAQFMLDTESVTVTSTGNGTGTFSGTGLMCGGGACTGAFFYNTVVTITATPNSVSTFAGWTGCDSPSGNTCTVTMTGNKTITGAFNLTTKTLSVTKTGSGAVVSSPGGINCGSTCAAPFVFNATVTLTATAASHYGFAYWSGACSGASPTCRVTMTGDTTVTAVFDSAVTKEYTLTVNKTKITTGDGTVSSSDGMINCGHACTKAYYPNAPVSLSATPGQNSLFTGWTGACTGTGTCSVTMDKARTVTAVFAGPERLTVTKHNLNSGDGTVLSSPSGIDCGTTCHTTFPYNTPVTLNATAITNSTFTGWTGACTGTGACIVPMNKAESVTATFVGPQTLIVVKNGKGSLTSAPPGINCGTACKAAYPLHQSVTLTATPDAGYHVHTWAPKSLQCAGTSCVVPMDKPQTVTVTVNFIKTVTSGEGEE